MSNGWIGRHESPICSSGVRLNGSLHDLPYCIFIHAAEASMTSFVQNRCPDGIYSANAGQVMTCVLYKHLSFPAVPNSPWCLLQAFHSMLSPRTKLVAMVHVSNMTGAVLPAQQVAEAAHKVCPFPTIPVCLFPRSYSLTAYCVKLGSCDKDA